MIFSPKEAPVYGAGNVLEISFPTPDSSAVGDDQLVPPSTVDELYLVLSGRSQCHVVTMHHSHDISWFAPLPGHSCAEKVSLSVVRHVPHEELQRLAQGEFLYQYDSAYYLAQFLINSVNNPHALDDLELIKSDNFDLANEILSTLDERLSSALKHILFPEGWHLLGSDQDLESNEGYCRETLLHFTGRLGLHKTALFLLTKPGSEEALSVMNREGLLPCGVAAHSGFDDISELFSGYNTSGMITDMNEDLDTDCGIIHNYGSKGTSLTFSTDSIQDKTMDDHIEMLREMDAMLRRGRSPSSRRQYQTEWPSPALQQDHNNHHPGPHHLLEQANSAPYYSDHGSYAHYEGEAYSQQVEEALERMYENRRIHNAEISHLLPDCTMEIADNTSQSEGDMSDPHQYFSPASGVHIPSEVMEEATRQYGMLEGSIQGVHDMNDKLLELRETSLKKKLQDTQAVRRLKLARFSTSCPTLDAQRKACLLSPIHEGDQHKSMLDLAEELGYCNSAGDVHHPTPSQVQDMHQNVNGQCLTDEGQDNRDDDSGEGSVRICVNGVTVDSSADDLSRDNADAGVVRRRRSGRSNISREEEMNRRRSWCPDSPANYGGNIGGPWHDMAMDDARSLAMSGKSMSLSRLDCDDGSDEDYREDFQGGQQARQYEEHRQTSSPGRSPVLNRANDGYPQAAQSLTDLSHKPESRQLVEGDIKQRTNSVSGSQDLPGREKWTSLGVAHSNMTKSLSTPSIPAATQASDHTPRDRRDGHREGKQPSGPSHLPVQKLIEEYDARFCRQDEIEEEDEESAPANQKKEISLKEFLNEEFGTNSDKARMSGRSKEEKKRKPSVFGRIHNSYRNKKQKDKEAKPKHPHHFVPVSVSNAALCHVCHKPMANKPSLRCENCLINVHEHSCKDQVVSCDKNSSMKVLQLEGQTPAAMIRDRQLAALQGQVPSLKPSNSFKSKDRSPLPAKSMPQSAMPGPGHRHSIPAGGLLSSPPQGTTYLQWYHATHRFSLLDINEMDETDGPGGGQDIGHSNITETTSESMESLDTVGMAHQHFLEEEPDLMLNVDEPEAWNVTVDRKVLRKMNTKDVKRQDTIWELIQTEKHYVKRLKIMQRLFRDPMVNELNVPEEQTERMFPNLDQLVSVHSTFLRKLLALQNINPDRSVDEIGSLLVEQFSDGSAEKMKSAYGVFCSKHTEAIQLYKDIAKTEAKFRNFCRKTSNLGVCEKRELPDFILGVTVRLSKYPILIEAILKSTKDKKDRELVSKALQCSKSVVHSVDRQVALYEKLMEVYRAMDSRTTYYGDKKFKRQDLIANGRHLLHAGVIGWKNARSRVIETHTLVLTDLMVFLQKNEQKYTFLLQDNKSCVVPLYKLLVREKRDERDSHGIYVISQNRKEPEMYELVCQTRDERDQWMHILQEAIKNCPEEGEVQQPEVVTEDERRKQEEKSAKMKEIINKLHQKDDMIKVCCDEKNRLMMDLMEMSVSREDVHMHHSSRQDLSSKASVDVVRAAIQEASHLTTIIQGSNAPLSRSVSSVGEHVSPSYVNMPAPKRAETFAGFDSSFDTPRRLSPRKQFAEDYGHSPSVRSLPDTDYGDSVYPGDRHGGHSLQSIPSSSSISSLPQTHWEQQSLGERDITPMELSSEHGSMGELSSSVSSLAQPAASPTSTEQMASMVQLVGYLHNLMNLTAKQCTTVESLRAELAEAKEEISKLSADMHGRKNIYRHNQLEELRNLQENISRERQEWERTREREQEWLRKEKEHLEAMRLHLEKQESELRAKKEDLKRDRETLQRQYDMMREQGLLEPSTFMDQGHVVHTVDLDAVSYTDMHDAPQGRQVAGHRRSASADFYQGVPGAPVEKDSSPDQDPRGMHRRPRHSVSSIHSVAGPGIKQNIPAHLLSTRNEQRVGGANVQQLPLKLSLSSASAGSGGGGSGGGQRQQPHHIHPRAGSMSSLAGRAGGTNPGPVHPSPSQLQGMITRNQNSRSTPSNLALVMKLAEPSSGGKGRSASQPQPVSSSQSPANSSAPGGPGDNSSEIIYF